MLLLDVCLEDDLLMSEVCQNQSDGKTPKSSNDKIRRSVSERKLKRDGSGKVANAADGDSRLPGGGVSKGRLFFNTLSSFISFLKSRPIRVSVILDLNFGEIFNY